MAKSWCCLYFFADFGLVEREEVLWTFVLVEEEAPLAFIFFFPFLVGAFGGIKCAPNTAPNCFLHAGGMLGAGVSGVDLLCRLLLESKSSCDDDLEVDEEFSLINSFKRLARPDESSVGITAASDVT